jgi:photosystem II stability/assembly factor-like uncharacterized protein
MSHPFIQRFYPLLLASVCSFSLTQCHKTNTNPVSPVTLVQPPKSMQVIEGNNLVGGVGLTLPDTIIVRIIPNDLSDAEKYFFNSTSNDSVGNLQVMNLEIDSGGVNVTLSWQTGRKSPRQDIKFYLNSNCTTKGCQVLDSVTISVLIKQTWTNVYSGSGNLTDIRFTSDQTALAVGNYFTGIVRTVNGGTSWSSTPAFRDDLNQLCFLDSLNGFVTVANNYAYYTTDGGKTFNQGAWAPPIVGDGSSQDFSMPSLNTIYSVGIQGTIVKSVDDGQSWQKYPGFSFINEFFALTCIDPNNCFACGEAGKVVKTSDGGQNWQSSNINLNNYLSAICFLNKDIGFAGGQGGALIRTMDGGSTWNLVRTNLHFTIFSIRFFDMQHGVVVSQTGEIADTNDGGITWQEECPGDNGVFGLQKAAIKDLKTVFAVQNGSIFRYDITP